MVNHFNDIPRFIPAGAGNTTGSRIRQITGAGNTGVGQIPNLNNPVYPRWRGNTTLPNRCAHQIAVYPAGAGNTRSACAVEGKDKVYPAGAGTRTPGTAYRPPARFIPAGAGTRRFRCPQFPDSRFIPLAREHDAVRDCQKFGSGLSRWRGNTAFLISPPRRSTVYPAGAGTRDFHSRVELPDRFIPAGAGTPTTCPLTTNNGRFIPLARGTHLCDVAKNTIIRFIPAGAGTPSLDLSR